MDNKVSYGYGAIIAVLTALLGEYWFLFVGFLTLNVVDYVTGVVKSKLYTKTISSSIGAKGIAKKVSYWVVIGTAFYVSFSMAKLGTVIGVDLAFVELFGWFTLASYMVNEMRSIIENLVQMNVNIPQFLIKGLAIADELIDKRTDLSVSKDIKKEGDDNGKNNDR